MHLIRRTPHFHTIVKGAAILSFSLLTFFCHDLGADDVVATYKGGEITRAEVDEWVEVVGENTASRIPSLQVESFALAKYLSENSTREDDPAIQMALLKTEAANIRGYYTGELNQSQEIDPAEIQKYFEEYKGQLGKPERIRLRSIFKSKAGKTPEEIEALRDETEGIRTRLLEGEDMKELAVQESQSTNRFDEGMVGVVARGSLRPELEKMVFSLEEGEITPVIEAKDGFHIFRCEKRMAPVVLTDEEKKERIVKFITRNNFKTAWEQQQKEWMEGAKLDFDALQSGEMTEAALTLKNGKSYTVEQIIALLASGPQPFDPRMEGATKEGVIQRLRTFIVDVSATDAYLESNPRPDIDSIMERKKMQIIANLELKKRAAAAPETSPPTEEEIREVFESTKHRLVKDPAYKMETFTMRIDNNSLQKDFAVLKQFRDELAADPSLAFVDAAKNLPPDILERSKVSGPHMKDEIQVRSIGRAEFLAVQNLKPGEVSPLFRTRMSGANLWIIRLLGIEESRPFTFEESVPGLTTYLTRLQVKEREDSLKKDILEEMNFEDVEKE